MTSPATKPVRIYTGDPSENLYGCKPCPKCGGEFRAAYSKSGMIECEDCGFKEPYTKAE